MKIVGRRSQGGSDKGLRKTGRGDVAVVEREEAGWGENTSGPIQM